MDLFELTATIGLDASSFASGLQSAAGLMQSFANSVLNFGKDVIQTGMGFDKQMSAVEAVLGKTEGTMENMSRLRAFALDQAHDSIFTAEQTGQAYYYMGMAGWKTEQMLAGLPGVMNLAAASGEDLGRVSDIVTDSITAFGLTANDVSGYVDILAATVTNSNTDVNQLGNAFKYAAPVAGALGVAVDDTALSLGLMANAGIKSSQAGTTMRQIFSRLGNDTNNARKVMEKLGTTVFDDTGKMRDWGDIITEARPAWAKLTDEQKAQYATTIAGQRGMSGFMAIMNATEEDVTKLERALAESSGAAKDMAETKLDNLWGDTVKFNSALDVLKVAIYDDVKGPMREIVQYGTGAIDRIRGAIEEGGLTGGIEQLGVEIEAAGEKFAPMLESLGTALAPLMNSLFTQVLPLAEEAGAKLGAGLMRGISNSLTGPGASPLMSLLGTVVGAGGTGFSILGTLAGAFRGSGETANPAYAVENIHINGVDLPASEVQAAIDAATAAGDTTVTIAGVEMDVAGAQMLVDQVAADLSTVDTSGMVSQIGSAGTSAGSQVASAISSALSAASYSINVAAKVTGLPSGGGVEKNARAMNVGRIFDRPTVFGYANNAYQVAGDAGPEAVIGTNSLVHMIAEAVGSGMRAYAASAPAAQSAPKPIVLQLNGRTVARAIVDDMDNALGNKAERRSTGRV